MRKNNGTDVAASPSVHNSAARCTTCHFHEEDFKGLGGGPDCKGCHDDGEGTRRAILNDFANGTTPNFRSHHVGNGLTMGGTLNKVSVTARQRHAVDAEEVVALKQVKN